MSALLQPPPRRDSLAPAFLAALALHTGLLAALIFLHAAQPLPAGAITPITLVETGPTTDSRPAQAAPVAQEAQTEEPLPQERAALPPPTPVPTPAAVPPKPHPAPIEAEPVPKPPPRPVPPPKPQPAARPAPAAKAVPTPKPAPAPKAPARAAAPAQDTFLDTLSQSLGPTAANPSKSAARPGAARRGRPRVETGPPKVDAGTGVSQSDLQGLQQLLERLWNPNCSAPGADQVVVAVKFAVDGEGHVIGRVTERGENGVAARRAIDAVHQAEPYAGAYRNNVFTVNFDAAKACAGKEG